MREKGSYVDFVPWFNSRSELSIERVFGFTGWRLKLFSEFNSNVRFEKEFVGSYDPDYSAEYDRCDDLENASPWLIMPPDVQIVCDESNQKSTGIRIFSLKSLPPLHREFGALGEDETKIQKFASRYGFLGTHTYMMRPDADREAWAECLLEWKAEIHLVMLLTELWDCIRLDAPKKKFEAIVEIEFDQMKLKSSGVSENINQFMDAYLLFIELYDVRLAKDPFKAGANKLFCQLLEFQASLHCVFKIQLDPYPSFKVDAFTLIGTIYMHLIDEVLGQSLPVTKCTICNRWFQSSHKGTFYCSNACKMKAYRRRKKNGD